MILPSSKIRKNKFVRDILNFIWGDRASAIIEEIKPFITKKDRIMDLGSGLCDVTHTLRGRNYNITAVDIKDLSVFEDLIPIVYDGRKLPFPDDSFDICLLLDMLHHTPNPENIIMEAKRVSKKLIIMENIYQGTRQKYLSFIMDSVTNMEFFDHPHTNKTDTAWKEIFKKFNLHLISAQHHKFWRFFLAATYYLEKPKYRI